MRPAPRSRMCAPTTRQPRYVPRRFVARTSSHSATSISKNERNSVRAALLTSACTSPNERRRRGARSRNRARARRAGTSVRRRPARRRAASWPRSRCRRARRRIRPRAAAARSPRRFHDRSRDDGAGHGADATARRARPGRPRQPARARRPRTTRRTAAALGSGRPRGRRRSRPACRGRGCRVSGSSVVVAQRPTCACTATTAPPTRTRSPIQPSSACGSTPSTPMVMRKRRPSTGRSAPAAAPSASSDPVETSEAPAFCPRSWPSPSRSVCARRSAFPASSDSASFHGPVDEAARHRATVEARLDAFPRLDSPSTTVPSGKSQQQPPVLDGGLHGEQTRHALGVDQPAVLVDDVEAVGHRGRRSSRARSRRPRPGAST